jgi:small basic protein
VITKKIPGILLMFGGISATLGWTFDNPVFVSVSLGMGVLAVSLLYLIWRT